MNLSRVFAITVRIISQFRRDHRSLALIFVAPVLVMSIFGYVFRSQENTTVNVALVNLDKPPDRAGKPCRAGNRQHQEAIRKTWLLPRDGRRCRPASGPGWLPEGSTDIPRSRLRRTSKPRTNRA